MREGRPQPRHSLLSFFLELLGPRLEGFVWVAVTTFCFDIALLELLLPLMCNCMRPRCIWPGRIKGDLRPGSRASRALGRVGCDRLDVVETEISKQGPELKARLAKYPRLRHDYFHAVHMLHGGR